MISKTIFRKLQNNRVQFQASQQFLKTLSSNQEISDLDKRDIKLLQEEMTQENIGVKDKLYFKDWENGQKTVLISEYVNYQMMPFFLLSLSSGSIFVKTLIGGAGTYFQLIILPLICLPAAKQFGLNYTYNSANFITKINLHQDGLHLDVEVQNMFNVQTFQNVKIEDFIVNDVFTQTEQEQAKRFNLQMAFEGNSRLVTFNDKRAFLSTNSQQNQIAFDQILKRQKVNVENI